MLTYIENDLPSGGVVPGAAAVVGEAWGRQLRPGRGDGGVGARQSGGAAQRWRGAAMMGRGAGTGEGEGRGRGGQARARARRQRRAGDTARGGRTARVRLAGGREMTGRGERRRRVSGSGVSG
jgi:hypothetical protein